MSMRVRAGSGRAPLIQNRSLPNLRAGRFGEFSGVSSNTGPERRSSSAKHKGRATPQRRPPFAFMPISSPSRDHAISNSPAAPCPPPMHMVTTTYFAPRRLPSIRAWPARRAPDTP